MEPESANEGRRLPTVEELRLASSDLEDCEEVWIGELGEYMLETQKRQKQVEVWFEASVLVSFFMAMLFYFINVVSQERNSTTAQTMSRHYAARIARIPPPPPSPPPPLSIEDDLLSTIHNGSPQHPNDYVYGMESGYRISPGRDRPFDPSAEDAARDFEDSVLGHNDALLPSSLGTRDKGKIKEVSKRPASGDSDGSSDLEVPTTFRKGLGPANKKRKIDKDGDITDDLERSITGEHPNTLSNASNVASVHARGKGKGKQVQREMSLDSMASTTPKGQRKKPGPKKKLDTFPPETVELLGLGASASASADVTPIPSRLSSPALATSIVFELGEVPPALKKAKKVDDAAMLKRLKTLEETQRKVWTNIARRDVAKVRHCRCAHDNRD
jgi:chromatin-remodeling ATPase INO80